ncbi:hypothetical protein ACIBF5_29010 [Micromonospora sp. NPDC050417]|uniref:hypothetical protein n=1 Tax=Micromonospora sp. NPDC050417 TaxID=3364280 RepID=UPI0037B1DD02
MTKGELHASRIKDYNTIAELKAEAVTAVRVTAGTARVEVLHEVPFTVTTVAVESAPWGQGHAPGKTLEVRQTGSTTVVAPDLAPLLVAGREYLLF